LDTREYVAASTLFVDRGEHGRFVLTLGKRFGLKLRFDTIKTRFVSFPLSVSTFLLREDILSR